MPINTACMQADVAQTQCYIKMHTPAHAVTTVITSQSSSDVDSACPSARQTEQERWDQRVWYLGSHLGKLIGLGMDPAQWLQLSQVVMVWQLLRKMHQLVITPLRHHDRTPDLLDLHSDIQTLRERRNFPRCIHNSSPLTPSKQKMLTAGRTALHVPPLQGLVISSRALGASQP